MGLGIQIPNRTKKPSKQRKNSPTASKQYNKAVGATYELLRNLLAGEPQTQWNCIVQEMHECDSWAGANGERHDGKRPKGFKAFSDCLELHKLTVFTADAAERQQYYIQQGVRKPQKATVLSSFPEWKF